MKSHNWNSKRNLFLLGILLIVLILPALSVKAYSPQGQSSNALEIIGNLFSQAFYLKQLEGSITYLGLLRFLIFLLLTIIYEEIFKHMGGRTPIGRNAGLVISIILAIITVMFVPVKTVAAIGSQLGFVGLLILWLPLIGILIWIAFIVDLRGIDFLPGTSDILKGIAEIILAHLLIYLLWSGSYLTSSISSHLSNLIILPLFILPLHKRRIKHD